jgi:hypothetical protein
MHGLENGAKELGDQRPALDLARIARMFALHLVEVLFVKKD